MSQALTPKAENHSSDFDLTSAREFPKDAPTVFPSYLRTFCFWIRGDCPARRPEAIASRAVLESQFPAVTAIMAIV
jgi:hypothetical protein